MTDQTRGVGIIGAGNMGEAIIGALIRAGICRADNICILDVRADRMQELREAYGVKPVSEPVEIVDRCEVVILAVKPQQMPALLTELGKYVPRAVVTQKRLFISIAAGIPLSQIERALYSVADPEMQRRMPVVRIMPNTPALVLAGMAGMSCNANVLSDDRQYVQALMSAMGDALEVRDEEMDAVTAMSGSGPAYVYYFVEAMVDAGIALGFEPAVSHRLTLATFKGALKLLEERKEPPEELRRKVTSPGGTTEAAVGVLENNQVKEVIIEAIQAAARRSRELSGE